MFIYSPIKGPQGAYRFLKKVLWLYQILMNENSLILNDQNFSWEFFFIAQMLLITNNNICYLYFLGKVVKMNLLIEVIV